MAHPSVAPPIADPLDDYDWLVGPEAVKLLKMAAGWLQPTPAQVSAVRSQCPGQRAHLVLEQVALRHKAQAKFTAAGQMFFTPVLLEQASDEVVAAYKAQRFGRIEAVRVFDLCCGIGGDLLSLAARGDVVGIDRDPLAVFLAQANASAAANFPGGLKHKFELRVGDAREADVGDCGAWHIDPDRRPKGFRTTHVDLHEPPSDAIDRLLDRNPNASVKLAPAARMSGAWLDRSELEWISRDGQCRQLVAWFGRLAGEPGRRRATILGTTSTPPRTVVGDEQPDPPLANRIGRYVFEPDAAVLAARLSGTLAAEHCLGALAPHVAYWTGDSKIADPALACFEVLEVLPLDIKQLKSLLGVRGIGRLEIKKRGVEHDPAALRRLLGLQGEHEATLLVTRIARRATAILARRVT